LEISEKWGGSQIVTGPILTIPVKQYVYDDKGKKSSVISNLHILPDSLLVEGEIATEISYQGILVENFL